jgi:hypothetical protein
MGNAAKRISLSLEDNISKSSNPWGKAKKIKIME